MTYILLLLAAVVLTLLVFWKKRSLYKEYRDEEFLYYFLRSSLEFLVPLTIVLSFYLGLLAVISMGWQDISLQSLIRLEGFLATIHSYTQWKLSKLAVLGIFVGIFVLGLLRLPLETRTNLYQRVETIYKWNKRIYVFFVLLCSFTLLGTQLGPVSDDLKLRIKLTREGYAELRKETEETLSEAVAVELHTKTHDSLPPAYQTALKQSEEIGSQASVLQHHYVSAQREYGVKSNKTEAVLVPIETRRRANLETEIRLPAHSSSKRVTAPEPEPREVTYRKVTEAKTAITEYRKKTPGRIITFLSTVDGKKLTVQGAKVVTDFMKSGALSPVLKAHPLAELFVDTFFKPMDDVMKAKIEKFADGAARSFTQNPGTIESTIKSESLKIVNETQIKISPEMAQKGDESGRALREELTKIEAAKAEVDSGIQRAKDTKVEKLFAQLQSPDESVRRSAARELSRNTDLSQSKVNQLVSIMRNGNRSWVTNRYRPPGLHCTDITHTSVKYYAASALEGMKSKFVTDQIVSEARRSMSDSVTTRRVTDPGWI